MYAKIKIQVKFTFLPCFDNIFYNQIKLFYTEFFQMRK